VVSKTWVTDTWQVAGLFQGGHEDIPKTTTIHIPAASLPSPPNTWQLLLLLVSLLYMKCEFIYSYSVITQLLTLWHSIVTRLWNELSAVQFSTKSRDVSLLHKHQTSSGTHLTSFPLFPGVFFSQSKQSWCEDDQTDLQLKPWLRVSAAKPLLPCHEQRQLLNVTKNF